MERKIGEIFEYNGEWYQCVKSDGTCNGCVGKFQPYSFCNGFKECIGKIFKKLEKVGEPITVNGKNVKLLKTTIANCDNCAFYKDVNCDFTCYPRKCHGGEMGTYVEIKNKEDMEEKKLNLKPFDIQKAKAGKPVCTRDGRKARIICFDLKNDEYPIVAAVGNDSSETLFSYTTNGEIADGIESDKDLMMLPEKKEGWVALHTRNKKPNKRSYKPAGKYAAHKCTICRSKTITK